LEGKTKKGEWIEVSLPVDKFVATWRGRVFPIDMRHAPREMQICGLRKWSDPVYPVRSSRAVTRTAGSDFQESEIKGVNMGQYASRLHKKLLSKSYGL
jgi:hypothetical protein